MKEIEYLDIIHKTLSDTSYLGDDCAYLRELGIYVTHDSLAEDVHFSLTTTSAYELGYKAAAVNLSDVAAVGAKPAYITISLSLPKNTEADFVEEFYKGINDICVKYDVVVAGGDLTGSDKIFISICAIGKKVSAFEISRSFAKAGDFIITTGEHGNSAGGLKLLANGMNVPKSLVNFHLKPEPQLDKSDELVSVLSRESAMMDTSDGLADGLYKISQASEVTMEIYFEKLPISEDLKKTFPENFEEMILWGGEDFQLLACVNGRDYEKLDKSKFFLIGEVVEKIKDKPVIIKKSQKEYVIDEKSFNKNSFKHFEDKDQ